MICEVLLTNQNLKKMKTLKLHEMETIEGGSDWSCGLAIAGTIAATAGFAFVTGGAGLIVALAAKGIATASVIDSCAF